MGNFHFILLTPNLLSNTLTVQWNKKFGMAGGNSQTFDILVDNDGNYLLGGHTDVGTGVVNWDYLALKVDPSGNLIWRKTFGQPRGFDARYVHSKEFYRKTIYNRNHFISSYIHDEMYSVQLDSSGNYLLLGGSGDEYPYSKSCNGWSSDIWVSYLVVLDTAVNEKLT